MKCLQCLKKKYLILCIWENFYYVNQQRRIGLGLWHIDKLNFSQYTTELIQNPSGPSHHPPNSAAISIKPAAKQKQVS